MPKQYIISFYLILNLKKAYYSILGLAFHTMLYYQDSSMLSCLVRVHSFLPQYNIPLGTTFINFSIDAHLSYCQSSVNFLRTVMDI